jgi:hypothetical protein
MSPTETVSMSPTETATKSPTETVSMSPTETATKSPTETEKPRSGLNVVGIAIGCAVGGLAIIGLVLAGVIWWMRGTKKATVLRGERLISADLTYDSL